MACDLLSKGWTTNEVNRRLGHKPSSREIDKYVNWLALDNRQPKRKFHEHQVSLLTQQIDELTNRENLSQQRQNSLQQQMNKILEVTNKLLCKVA